VVPAGSRPAPVPEKLVEPVIVKTVIPLVQMQSSDTPTVARLKYEMCKNWRTKGSCPYGDKCLFAHGDQELSRRTTAPPTVVAVKVESPAEIEIKEKAEEPEASIPILRIEEDLPGIKKRGCSESRASSSPPVTFRPIDTSDCKVNAQMLTSPRVKIRENSCEKLMDAVYEH